MGSIRLARAEARCQEDGCKGRIPCQPIVGVELVERVDSVTVSVVRGVRHRCFEHPDDHEGRGGEERAAECDRAVAGVAVSIRQPASQAGAEEDQQKRNQRRNQKSNDLMLTSVVLPVGERLCRTRLAARIVPEQHETDEE
jgi:hypothetical protein